MPLYKLLAEKVSKWRQSGYPHDDYPAISEILDYAVLPELNALRYLRTAQLQALETYWYLRLIEGTPHIFDLYLKYYRRTSDLLDALGINPEIEEIRNLIIDEGLDALWNRIRKDDKFVKNHKLDTVRETITLDYSSYILALAMGAGKTMLIGTIIATEFAMALEYHPDKEGPFVQNALVFAPGLTILESLRELAEIDYSKILPSRLFKPFDVSYKLIFPQENRHDLPVIRGSRYNLIVTNTEKIRIQKRTYRHHTWSKLYFEHMMEQAEAEANLRLQAIASLPNLGIFSDEAHHTYGQEIGKSLKRVRQTVDYLHQNTDLICVINTTGTPYYERQPLRDVVIWYGLSQGIKDDILKSLEDNIYAYDYDEGHSRDFVSEIVKDFLKTYGDVTLPNGAPARLAMYFPQNKDLNELRPIIEQTLVQIGYPTDIVLRNTNQSSQSEINAFNRLNDPSAPHRVILLVNKGTEGWNCPSLFACALVRKLTGSNNFVLQASTRCLRQVSGNDRKARIYLSMDNRGILDHQLQETYGETIEDLRRTSQDTRSDVIHIRKLNIPPLVIKKILRRVVSLNDSINYQIELIEPNTPAERMMQKQVFTPGEQPGLQGVMEQRDQEKIIYQVAGCDLYNVATQLAANYRLDIWLVYRELKRIYGRNGIVPETHLPELESQIESQIRSYQIQEEEVEVALALVKPEGFETVQEDGQVIYTADITYHKSKEHLLLQWKEMQAHDPGGFGFHYDPYNFDSNPEKDFFIQLLSIINVHPQEVDDIYFTGALTDPNKTDFLVEYLAADGKWRHYSPDFLIRRKDGRCLIVEIKQARMRNDEMDGQNGRKALAVRKWVGLNPDKLRYEMVFVPGDTVAYNQLDPAKEFIQDNSIGIPNSKST